MSVVLASEIWSEVKRYISSVDRSEAAETVVSVLIDNDVDAEEIKNTFKGDGDIKRALSQYAKDDIEEEDEEDEEDYDDSY